MPVTEIVLFEFDRTPVPGVIELILNPAGAVAAVIRNELMFELPFGVSFLSGTVMFWVPAPTEVGNRRLNCFSGAALPGSASNANTTVAATRAISDFRVRLTNVPPQDASRAPETGAGGETVGPVSWVVNGSPRPSVVGPRADIWPRGPFSAAA